MLLKLTDLAVLYFNLEESNRYDIDNKKDREYARSCFSNLRHYDKARLEAAKGLYVQRIEAEFADFLAKLAN